MPSPDVAQFKDHKEDKEFFDEEGVTFSSRKTVATYFCSGICYLLNLPNGFKNPARKTAYC